jgi:hypothetical protein
MTGWGHKVADDEAAALGLPQKRISSSHCMASSLRGHTIIRQLIQGLVCFWSLKNAETALLKLPC